MQAISPRVLVDKEREFVDGKLHFRLFLWEEETGQIIQVLAPVNVNIKKIIKEGVFDVI